MGISHPPGYPLFSMLAYAAGNFPLLLPRIYLASESYNMIIDWNPTFAWKVNNMCSILAALTVVLVAASTEQLLRTLNVIQSGHLIFIGAMLFAFSPLTWEYAAQSAEVFALNNFICAGVVFCTCRVLVLIDGSEDQGTNSGDVFKYLHLGAMLTGMAFANQHASALFLIVLIPAVLAVSLPKLNKHRSLIRILLSALAAFVIGASPYAVQIWIARTKPVRGSWGDLSSWEGISKHVFRKEYGTFQMGVDRQNIEGFRERLWLYTKHCSEETNHLIYPLLCVLLLWTFMPSRVTGEVNKSTSLSHTPSAKNSTADKDTSAVRKEEHKKNRRGEESPAVPVLPPGTEKNAETTSTSTRCANWKLLYILTGTYIFYVLVWHGVLSNLPLSAPMPYIVHARFWIQPHILLCLLGGTGAALLFDQFSRTLQISERTSALTQISIVVFVFAFMVQSRYSTMDRSKTGWIMHTYGEAILESLPQNSLLLAHTDLDWNPTRYLRECEGTRQDYYAKGRPDITHLNFQMIAYPWFAKKQATLYPNTVFPRVDFRGISTDRTSEGNAILVVNTLVGNGASTFGVASLGDTEANNSNTFKNAAGHAFTGGIYLDMQAVNDIEIGDGGKWRGLTLLPWGLVYRVFGPVDFKSMETLHIAAFNQFQRLQKKMSAFAYSSDSFKNALGKSLRTYAQYGPGSWEFAALSVYNDARMQLGLNLLTWAIAMQKNADLQRLPILLDRMYTAASLLLAAHEEAAIHGTLSSSQFDLHKNTAMAWMRTQGLLGIAFEFKDAIRDLVKKQSDVLQNVFPHNQDMLAALVTDEGYAKVLRHSHKVIAAFLASHPEDKDRGAFEASLQQIDAAMGKLEGTSHSKSNILDKAETGRPQVPKASKKSKAKKES